MIKQNKHAVLSFILALGMLLSCGCQRGDNDTPGVTDESSAITNEVEITDLPISHTETADALSEVNNMELTRRLALCITEGGVSNDRESIFRRFAEYRELGVTAVRIDTYWSSPSSGIWEMSDITCSHFEAAKEYGLLLKLILPTIMSPPAWISSEDGAKLVDYNGRVAVNTVSYWYEGLTDYTNTAIRAMLDVIVESGYADVIGGVVVDMGPAGEPLYPPDWTQAEQAGEEVMWCYGDNAQADFRAEMQIKYVTIEAANKAWGSNYSDFADIDIPKPGEAKGELWRDVLTWYRDTKREFMAAQVDIFKAALADYGLANRPLILYLPGADFTEEEWEHCVEKGSASSGIRLACDNNYTVDLAAASGCVLQYTGITGVSELKLLRNYMYESGNGDIPVFGENGGGDGADLKLLRDIIVQNKLYGIDYTHCHYLYEADGETKNERYALFGEVIDELADFIEEVDLSEPTANVETAEAASPDGDILCFDIDFDLPEGENLSYIFLPIATPNIELCDGDTLEYDLLLSEDMQGIGSIDGIIDGKTMRDSFGMTDSNGVRVHPNADHSDFAYSDWYHRVIRIGNGTSDGGTLTELMLAAHPERADGDYGQIHVRVYYDNIVIKREGSVICEIFRNAGDCEPGKASMTLHAKGSASVIGLENIP